MGSVTATGRAWIPIDRSVRPRDRVEMAGDRPAGAPLTAWGHGRKGPAPWLLLITR